MSEARPMKIRNSIVTMLAAAVLAAPAWSFAQSERGTITGVVTDETKAAVPGVTIKVINNATGVTANVVSSESGTYTAPNLQPGTYKVEATLEGFKTSTVENIVLSASSTIRADV